VSPGTTRLRTVPIPSTVGSTMPRCHRRASSSGSRCSTPLPTRLTSTQRAHWSIDSAARIADVSYTTIRPAIFSASLLAAAGEVRASPTWTGLADTGPGSR